MSIVDDYDVYLVMQGIVELKSLDIKFRLKRRIKKIMARTDLRPYFFQELDKEKIKYEENTIEERPGFYTSRGCYKTRFKKL